MENTNREVKIAIVVGIIMITLCAIAIIAKNVNKKAAEDLNIHVYKHVITNKADNSGIYYECNVPTDKKSIINIEFKKIMNLKDSAKNTDEKVKAIEGNYKVSVDSNFVAFDDSKANLVYRNDTTSLYSYRSNLYEVVEEACKDINLNTVEQQKDKQKDQNTDNTKQTKKDSKSSNKK